MVGDLGVLGIAYLPCRATSAAAEDAVLPIKRLCTADMGLFATRRRRGEAAMSSQLSKGLSLLLPDARPLRTDGAGADAAAWPNAAPATRQSAAKQELLATLSTACCPNRWSHATTECEEVWLP